MGRLVHLFDRVGCLPLLLLVCGLILAAGCSRSPWAGLAPAAVATPAASARPIPGLRPSVVEEMPAAVRPLPGAEAPLGRESAGEQVARYWYSFRSGVVFWGAWVLGFTLLSAFFLPQVSVLVVRFILNRAGAMVTVWGDFLGGLFNRNLREVVAAVEEFKQTRPDAAPELLAKLSSKMNDRTKRLVRGLRGDR